MPGGVDMGAILSDQLMKAAAVVEDQIDAEKFCSGIVVKENENYHNKARAIKLESIKYGYYVHLIKCWFFNSHFIQNIIDVCNTYSCCRNVKQFFNEICMRSVCLSDFSIKWPQRLRFLRGIISFEVPI